MGRSLLISSIAALAVACTSGPRPAPAPPARPPAAVTTTARAAAPDAAALDAAAATITPADVHRRLAFLASDELRGRDTPSPGLERAAEYIAGEFRTFGLRPAGDDGTFIQRWPYTAARFATENVRLIGRGPGGTARAELGRDFFLLPGPNDSVSAPLVFAAAGATLGPIATGKVVAFDFPGAEPDMEWQRRLIGVIQGTMAAQPAAVMLVLDPDFDDIDALVEQGAEQTFPLPILGVSRQAGRELFRVAGRDYDELREAGRTLELDGATATIVSQRMTSQTQPPNVVAILPGSDPALRDTYVVFSAHIDHVGVGTPDASGDSIFNGADDDASGTTALIEVAQAFAALTVGPARSLIFLGVSGEEKGLLGSRHFTENPSVPRDAIVANINLDMIGRNAPDTVVAIGQDYTSLGRVVQEVATAHPELGLTVAPDLWPEENLFLRSDHFNFARIGVPAIFFTTGLHDQYHKQSDEIELIDTDKLSRVARLVFYLGSAIAAKPDAPTWTELGRRVIQSAGGG